MDNHYHLSLRLGSCLQQQNIKIATAESCTGGGLAQCLTEIPGASKWFECGLVTYSNDAKQALLGVLASTLNTYGAVSEEVAKEMALGLLAKTKADIGISITGIAGPGGGTQHKPVGTVWTAIATKKGLICAKHLLLTGGRAQVRALAVGFALHWLLEVSNK